MKASSIAIVLIAIVLACAGASFLLHGQGAPTHSIAYELNGGEELDEMPSEFTEGKKTAIPNPGKDGFAFAGWYFDADLTEPFNGDTSRLKADIVLYADWSVSEVGNKYTYSVSGNGSSSPGSSRTYTGTVSYSYLCYDEVLSEYFVKMERHLKYTEGAQYAWSYRTYETDETDMYWTTTVNASLIRTEAIDTIDGKVECEVWSLRTSNTTTEEQWVGIENGVAYRIKVLEQATFWAFEDYTLELTKKEKVEVESSIEVAVYEEDGVSASGGGVYAPGQRIVLTAETEDGTKFKGWYDSDMNLLSAKKTYKHLLGGADETIYACSMAENDLTVEADGDMTVSAPEGAESVVWVLRNPVDMSEVATLHGRTVDLDGLGGEYVMTVDYELDGVKHREFGRTIVMGVVERTFSWTYTWETGNWMSPYKSQKFAFTLSIDYADVVYAKNLLTLDKRWQTVDRSNEKAMVDLCFTDERLAGYTYQVLEVFEKACEGHDDKWALNMILSFAQNVEYMYDIDSTGYEEYFKLPLETLYDRCGDCEDTSYLCAMIYKGLGYDTALLIYDEHMAVGVIGDGIYGNYYSYEDKKYFFCETTAAEYAVGEIPESLKKLGCTVLPL